MNKGSKITITITVLLLALVPLVYFLVYPIYNDIVLKKNSFDIYRFTKQISINLLTQISPSTDVFAQEILGTNSIEESLKAENIVLKDTLLEEAQNNIAYRNTYHGEYGEPGHKGQAQYDTAHTLPYRRCLFHIISVSQACSK